MKAVKVSKIIHNLLADGWYKDCQRGSRLLF